jgi:protein involved in polysaccharide export with SLBB domain
VAVQADGSISLPLVDQLMVRGLTISQAEERIRQRFLDGPKPILTMRNRILVSLMRKRTVSVYVLRGDDSASASRFMGRANLSNQPVNSRSDNSQRADRLQLPAGDNDLLNALSRTGGLPGVNARPGVRISSDRKSHGFSVQGQSPFPRTGSANHGFRSAREITTVPTRQTPGFPRTISRNDIRLSQGDVVVVEPRDTEVFYTSGLLRGGEFPIPRDRGLDVVEAVSIAGGTLTSNGPLNTTGTELLVIRRRPDGSQFTIAVDLNRAISNPAERIQVRPGDVLMLRYFPAEQIRNIGLQTLGAAGLRQLIGR